MSRGLLVVLALLTVVGVRPLLKTLALERLTIAAGEQGPEAADPVDLAEAELDVDDDSDDASLVTEQTHAPTAVFDRQRLEGQATRRLWRHLEVPKRPPRTEG